MDVDSDHDEQPIFSDNEEEDVGLDTNKKESELECDLSAYVLFHEGDLGSPCLSFDIIPDELGQERNCDNATSCSFIAGSQGKKAHLNSIILMKMANLKKLNQDDDDSEDDSDDEENLPQISSAKVNHKGCVNRIRATKINDTHLAASWSELGLVHIWDLTEMFRVVDTNRKSPDVNIYPTYSFEGHRDEGFAVDWSPAMPGTLATGDCSNKIFIWNPSEGGKWSINQSPLVAHRGSVEDVQWSPNEPHVLASCSVDKSIRIWDTRDSNGCKLTCSNAHDSDVNVIHWSRTEPFIASGGDDSKVLIWDLRKFESNRPVAHLQYHNKPICTVEWHPTESSVLATGGEDNKILQWDLAVEKDSSKQKEDVPDQLLFVHEGQQEVKETHWHPQVPGLMISTALSGFNVFKTISC